MEHTFLTVREVLKQLEDMGVISINQRNRIWKDYWSMKKALKSSKEA